MKKIDLHLHLTLNQLPKQGNYFMSSGENMLPHLEKLGIGKGVIMSSGEHAQSPNNEEVKAICEKFPEVYAWMCNIDECNPDEVYGKLEHLKKQGAVGVGELVINKKINDPFLDALFAAAEKLELPVTFHMSPEEGYSYGIVDEPGLPLLEEMLQKYPKLIVLGHSQTFWIEISKDAPVTKEERNSWGSGPVIPGGRVPELFSKYPNLHGDLSANSAGQAIMRDPEFGLNFLETYADRLFFATDMLNVEMEFPLGAWLDEQLLNGKLSKEAYEKICWKNAQRVFHI